ncbi:MAG: hypothetical protein IJZ53_11145 [Tyzzerella sp.]|nr:hypothetical protein [Tyzzerella sp.]
MDRVSRLIQKAKPKQTIHDILQKENLYLGLSYCELKAYRCPNSGKILPEVGTVEHTKYMYALLQARRNRKR